MSYRKRQIGNRTFDLGDGKTFIEIQMPKTPRKHILNQSISQLFQKAKVKATSTFPNHQKRQRTLLLDQGHIMLDHKFAEHQDGCQKEELQNQKKNLLSTNCTSYLESEHVEECSRYETQKKFMTFKFCVDLFCFKSSLLLLIVVSIPDLNVLFPTFTIFLFVKKSLKMNYVELKIVIFSIKINFLKEIRNCLD